MVSVTLILLIATAVAVIVLRYRALAGLPEALRQRAAAEGVTLQFGAARVGLRGTTLRDVQVTVARVPGLRMTADTVTAAFAGSAIPGTAPLTWGQRAFWLAVQRRGSSATPRA